MTLATTCVPPRPISAVEASHRHQHAVAPPSMARQQLFGGLAAFRRPLATPKCVERQCGRRVRRSVHQCCLARAGLDNHAAAGGTHHQVQVRAILGGSQRGEHPVQRRQICGIDLLSPGPGAQGLQDGASRFQRQCPRSGRSAAVVHLIGSCRRRRRADQGPGSLGNSGDEQNRRSRTYNLNYENSCQFCDPYSDMSYSGT